MWNGARRDGMLSGMFLRQVRFLLQIDNTMRILPFVLLTWLVLLADAQAQTAKESQDAAVAAIRKLGGTVTFDEENPGKPLIGVNLSSTKVTDAGLQHLKGLTKLQSLNLSRNEVSDAGLEHLKGLTSLQMLYLGGTKVTDAGLVHLKGLTSLQTLSLSHTKVTDAGLVHLKRLKFLGLEGCEGVTDAGLVHLKGLTGLTFLGLLKCKGVTDAGLVNLKGLTKLQTLVLQGTKVTDAGVKDLQAALPKCKIVK